MKEKILSILVLFIVSAIISILFLKPIQSIILYVIVVVVSYFYVEYVYPVLSKLFQKIRYKMELLYAIPVYSLTLSSFTGLLVAVIIVAIVLYPSYRNILLFIGFLGTPIPIIYVIAKLLPAYKKASIDVLLKTENHYIALALAVFRDAGLNMEEALKNSIMSSLYAFSLIIKSALKTARETYMEFLDATYRRLKLTPLAEFLNQYLSEYNSTGDYELTAKARYSRAKQFLDYDYEMVKENLEILLYIVIIATTLVLTVISMIVFMSPFSIPMLLLLFVFLPALLIIAYKPHFEVSFHVKLVPILNPFLLVGALAITVLILYLYKNIALALSTLIIPGAPGLLDLYKASREYDNFTQLLRKLIDKAEHKEVVETEIDKKLFYEYYLKKEVLSKPNIGLNMLYTLLLRLVFTARDLGLGLRRLFDIANFFAGHFADYKRRVNSLITTSIIQHILVLATIIITAVIIALARTMSAGYLSVASFLNIASFQNIMSILPLIPLPLPIAVYKATGDIRLALFLLGLLEIITYVTVSIQPYLVKTLASILFSQR